MQFIENKLKVALREGRPQIGCWLMMASPLSAEICASSGFDWVLIDMEHTPNDIPQVLSLVHAASAYSASIAVRAPWNDAVMIKRLLDMGVQSIMVPNVRTKEEAEAAVAAVRYPPRGIRGVSGNSRSNRFGRITDYFEHADDHVCLIAQIETQVGKDNAEEIASVDGIDCLFVGPADLAADLNYLGKWQDPAPQEAMGEVIVSALNAGSAAGILAFDELGAKKWLDRGATFVAVTGDSFLLSRGMDAVVKSFRGDI
ncbi:MAG: HpcH/HpaI aldolase/citrate lyase family protein [Burkholderiales bacterium]|nr:HpcH/HpaI aldolase/citrate lyase family protein [Burkholderiales bacterium]